MLKEDLTPNPKIIFKIISYGIVIGVQSIIASIGYILVVKQTNIYLKLDFISVLGLMLPVSSLMSAFSTACNLFVPPNYALGKYDRIKKFLFIVTLSCFIYGIICFTVLSVLGKYYYSLHFSDPNTVKMGAQYWRFYGLGLISVSFLFTFRIFFEGIGYGKLSLFAGVCELIGNLICAYILIPHFGNIGREISSLVGWTLAAIYLIILYVIMRKKIYSKQVKTDINNEKPQPQSEEDSAM